MLRVAATHGVRPERVERFRVANSPAPLTARDDAARAVRERGIFHMADIENNPEARPEQVEYARLRWLPDAPHGADGARGQRPRADRGHARGAHAVLGSAGRAAPDLRRPGRHRHRERAPLHGARRRATEDLGEALERQTATADILRVISRSPTDVQPVFDAIAEQRHPAVRRPGAARCSSFDGDLVHVAATHGGSAGAGRAVPSGIPCAAHGRGRRRRAMRSRARASSRSRTWRTNPRGHAGSARGRAAGRLPHAPHGADAARGRRASA